MRVYRNKRINGGSFVAPFMMMFMGFMIFVMSITVFSGFSTDAMDDIIGESIKVKAKLVDEETAGIYNSVYDFVLEYEYNGETYYYSETNWSGSKPKEGDVINVMIDPFNPEKVLGVSRSSGIFAGDDNMFGDVAGVFKAVRWGMMIVSGLLFLIGLVKLIKAIVRKRRAGNTIQNDQYMYNQSVNVTETYYGNGYNQNMNNQVEYGAQDRTYNLNGETYNSHGDKID